MISLTQNLTSTVTPTTETIMMDQLEMLSAREQLMEDIDCIIESKFSEVFPHTEDYEELRDELIQTLCDAVCKNFPTK